MRYRNRTLALALWLAVPAGLFAAEITGTVSNGTTNKPARGAEVVLISLASGMEEAGKTTTDAQGHFSIHVPDPGVPHLLQVIHQDVKYFKNAPPGASNTDVTIYDADRQVAGVFEDARVYTLQAEGGQLEVITTHTVRNESSPPRTQKTFEIELPPGAQLEEANATGPSGMPVTTSPTPMGTPNRYSLAFPVRPGNTEFKVSFKVAYSGSFEFAVTPESQLSELGVLLPKNMKFNGISRQFAQDRDEAGLAVFFVRDVPAREPVRFSVTGQGLAPREAQGGTAAPGAPADNAPVETSGGSSKTLWYVSAALVLLVAGGAFWLWRRASQKEQVRVPVKKGKSSAGKAAAAAKSSRPAPAAKPQENLLEVLKDELFQLERDRAEGKVPDEQYEKTKAGLDALIRRQLKKTEKG